MTLLDTELEGHGRMGFSIGIGVAPRPAAGEWLCALCDGNSVTESLHAHVKSLVLAMASTGESNHHSRNIFRVAAQGDCHGRNPGDDEENHLEFS